MDATLAAQIEAETVELLAQICPQAKGRAMYGGTMFEKEPGIPKTGFCGVFCYSQHVSLEFSQGALLDDPQNVLEGKGKFRRHIKLRTLADLSEKGVEQYLIQAAAF